VPDLGNLHPQFSSHEAAGRVPPGAPGNGNSQLWLPTLSDLAFHDGRLSRFLRSRAASEADRGESADPDLRAPRSPRLTPKIEPFSKEESKSQMEDGALGSAQPGINVAIHHHINPWIR
jgi:hypothetical protein